MATVELADITKVYDKATEPAVNKLNLSIEHGEFVVLVGPSGCGKSTALRMVAGLEQITGGTLTIDNNVVNNLPPQARDIAMVFQNYALYPHMTVSGNLDYPLRIAGVSKSEISQRVNEIAATLQLTELLNRKPAHLSGGQRQRVAMGRALIRKPACFLMDEPLSNLDAKLRVSMRAEIARIQKELGVTTLYVTHDQVEAMTMGDRVVVLNAGELQQVDEPDILYNRPANVFVAGFIGSPAMNLFSSRFTMAGGEANVQMGEQQLSIDADRARALGLEAYNGKEITAGIRPDDLYDDVTSESTGVVEAHIKLRESLGSEIICHLDVGVGRLQIEDPDLEELIAEGLSPQQDFVGRFAPSSSAKMGDTKEIRIDTSRLHFFDPKTGLRIDKT